MKKSLVAVIFLFIFLFNLFPKLPSVSKVFAVNCSGTNLPTIPLSVSPTSGNYKDEYTATLGWRDMPESDYKKYKDGGINVRMDVINREDPRKIPLILSPQSSIEDIEYLRNNKNQSYKFSPTFGIPKRDNPYILDIHLAANYSSSTKCKLEADPVSISVISTYTENPSAANNLKKGDLCNPELQTNLNFKCPTDSGCLASVSEGALIYTCSGKKSSWPSYADPFYLGKCDDPSGAKCISIKTAIGSIQTNPPEFVKSIFSLVLGLAGGIALIIIMISGYRFMASQGDPEKVGEARQQLTSAIVGLLFIIFSFVILEVIGVDILKIPGFNP